MQSLFYTGIMTFLWIVNLFNGTGLDSIYHVTELVRRLVIFITVADILITYRRRHSIMIEKSKFCTYGAMVMIFFIFPYIKGYGFKGLNYLWVFCLVYLLSKLEFDDKTILWTGLIYGALGYIILYIYNYGTALKGWNENSIAMIGMHSFLMLIVPFFKTSSARNKILLILATVLFSALLFSTDSRSGILFSFTGVFFAIGIIPRTVITRNPRRITLWLLLPLLIAIIVIIVSHSSVMSELDMWSYRQFNKPIFNGRDDLWKVGFNLLWEHPLFGLGDFSQNYWHNSAVTCLVTTGILGFITWIGSFTKIIEQVRKYLDDYIVVGSLISFIVLYVQQSVELGFISSSPTLIGYILLGVMLGRVKYLKAGGSYEAED